MKASVLFLIVLSGASGFAQSILKGKVTDSNGNSLPGTSIYLLNTLDGASANQDGNYTITTSEKGNHVLIVSSIGYETINTPVVLESKTYEFNFILKDAASELDEVVISAGTIEATNDRKVAVLRPLDIVTTAGAQGDIIGAIQTLPGTTRVGEQTGLFVRGGDASEAMVIIDGMTVQNFFTSDVPGVAQRGRFSPFQFKGTAFSSGGYSARYGQALSSVLELSTNDMPSKGMFNAGVTMSGLTASGAKVFKNNSLELTGNYINVAPFYSLSNTNFNFYKAPEGGSGSMRWVSKNGDKSIFKLLASSSTVASGTELPDITNGGEKYQFGLTNRNSYINSSLKQIINEKLYSFTAISFSHNKDENTFGSIPSSSREWRLQARTEIEYDISNSTSFLVGTEWQRYSVARSYDIYQSSFYETSTAVYAEAEWKPARWFALKYGARGEHSFLLDQTVVSPRVSAAIKTGRYSQVSVASGVFYQNPNNRYLMSGQQPSLQSATHYIANYQWITDKQTFRIEGYYKNYNSLVRELNTAYNPNPYRFITTPINNSGYGYAKGFDIFWRDRKLVKNLDYWISYSFVDTKRLYENFSSEATPSFISNHNLNLVTKYFIESIKVNVGATYTYASGRPYYDPNDVAFLQGRAPAYQNLSLNVSYVTSIKKVFTVVFLGVDNVLNRHNVFGYRYSVDGSQRYAIEPPIYRSVFAGLNISLSAFNKDEL